MSERMKTVIIVEDEKTQLEVISKTLNQYRFNPVSGATIAQSLELLRQHKDDAAVIILDMDMTKFPDYKEQTEEEGAPVTGIRLAQRLLKESTVRRPEIIIFSAFSDRVEYYKEAIKAGASAYLIKGNTADRESLLASVQALALKYSFQPGSLNDAEIAQLAEGHANSFELMSYFCQNKLSSELDLCLAPASYLLLLRNKSGSGESWQGDGESFSVYSDARDLPGVEEFDYLTLHRRLFDQVSRHKPYMPEADALPASKAERLKESTFIQLFKSSDVEIGLGILSPFPVKARLKEYPFSPTALAEALITHVAPVLESVVEKLMFRWREKQSLKLERVKTIAGFSDSVQRRLNALLRQPEPTTTEQAAEHYDRLQRLSQEFNDYSRTLSTLLEHGAAISRRQDDEMPRLSDIVQEIKSDYERLGYFDEVSFMVEADCLVPAERYYLSLALRELVKWAVERRMEVAREETQRIQFRCTIQGNWLEIYFSEKSERLSKQLREDYLFEPMSPLHVAQLIIEVACQGKLLDVTDESEAASGHLFKLRLLHN